MENCPELLEARPSTVAGRSRREHRKRRGELAQAGGFARKDRRSVVRVLDWLIRLIAASVMLQTLYFKFTAAPESVYIFTRVGMEPWGRIGSGVVELIASALLLWTPTAAWGAVIAVGTVTGAILFHLTRLGIEVQGDGGLLFGLACLVWICGAATILIHGSDLPLVGSLFPRPASRSAGV
jgi:hypothetical protein